MPSPHPKQYIAAAIERFTPLGWAISGRWNVSDTLKALDATLSDSSVDALLTDAWNTNNLTVLRDAAAPIRRWSNSYYPFKQILWDRVSLIEKAIAHHFAGSYDASIAIILAQIDGLSYDLTGKSFFSKGNSHSFLDDQTLAGMEGNLPTVRKVFSEDVRSSGSHGKLSRHGVLHGRDLSYATRINSTKTIVLVAALAEYFPRIADDMGAYQRRLHEQEVAGVQGIDENGRRIDNRKVHDVIRLAWDYDSAFSQATLLNTDSFDPRAIISCLAEKYEFTASKFTIHGDTVHNWWYVTLPAGQVMGYAARPSTNPKRRHPDVWRWDAEAPPSKAPWEDTSGWRSDDSFPRSPNWEPDVVI